MKYYFASMHGSYLLDCEVLESDPEIVAKDRWGNINNILIRFFDPFIKEYVEVWTSSDRIKR